MPTRPARQTTIITAVVTGVVCAALGAGAVYLWLQPSIDELSASNARLEADVADLESQVATLQVAYAAAKASTTTPASPATSTPTPPVAPDPSTAREFSFISRVVAGGSPSIVADYAQLLTGKEAAAAAKARGDESPPPNDYYIVNDNNKLRTLPVKPGIKVKLVSNPDGTIDQAGYTVPYDTWAGYFAAPSDENAGIRQSPYWLTVTGGVVTAIEQPYFP